MNRLELPPSGVVVPFTHPQPAHSFAKRSLPPDRCRSIDSAPFATFAPMHYEPGYAYPLVVWLHGTGGNEQQLRRVMPLVSMRNFIAVAPRGTCHDSDQCGAFDWSQSELDIELAEARVVDCIGAARRRFNVHPERIFLVGLDHGGTMALRVAWNQPHRYAGVATIGGPLPDRHRPFRQVNQMRSLPCLLATTQQSCDYPELDVCRDLRLLHTAGCTVALRQYPGGDELTTLMLADVDRWIMEIVCGPQA